ncbi:Acyl-CoA thioester hydrolase/BAAT N-terminal region [Saccharopolyspora kobensis]|uniref:Acyl-CoA thioester hydrolase/BAAT N-terminal region n=1 Tax=Saccharopolyspora kobensis TaxID=146035 RepID=A0A1H6CTL5_9PSEU|nr:acyl-CoA thioesterase/bile acid-CoA:amino acid N-acyltransferase family protein [Saccharopolyspora kobensis]SEG76340.1 Acyl-CoA thioester hydrolase/BAAT N-terminal region [Saccharopolyspora kobensis]SFC99059.1 Acyl-CoA thioester hydrolase/BAAT N-terminal region [Saccharopolyspora kobensis]
MRRVIGLLAAALLLTGCAGTARAAPALDVGSGAIDEPLAVVVSGLTPGERASVWARMTDDRGRLWTSWATFAADRGGRVDIAEHAPVGGSYAGADPTGLLWSMRLPSGEPVSESRAALSGPEIQLTVGVDIGGRTVAQEPVVVPLHAPGVRSVPVAEDGLVGDLHLPPGPGPHPGVILLGGSEGGRPNPELGRFLAGKGFAVLGLAYFGLPGLPPALDRIPVEYGDRAVGWLRARPEVSDGRVGVVGLSRGGEFALVLGAFSPGVGAVASVVGSGAVFPSMAPQASSWTHAGADLPPLVIAAPGSPVGFLADAARGRPGRFVDTQGTTATREELDRAAIPVERSDAAFLLVSAERDEMWPSQRLLDVAARRLGDRAEHVVQPGAGHFILDVPNLPTSYTTAAALIPGVFWAAGGGTPQANAAATADTVRRVVELFQEEL